MREGMNRRKLLGALGIAAAGAALYKVPSLGDNTVAEDKEAKLAERVPMPFPYGEAAIEAYLEKYPEEQEHAETLRSLFAEFAREEIDRTKLYTAESGVEYPYTSVKVSEFAKKLYRDYRKKELGALLAASSAPRQEFVFGTSIITAEGNEFNVVEEAMHQCVMHLPAALQALDEGREPDEHEIFTLGMPTNVLGRIPPNAADRFKAAPYEEMGKLYAEQIEKIANGSKPRSIELYGTSLGASIAVRTGEVLIDTQAASQDVDARERGAPLLQIRVENPVALGPASAYKVVQIPVGFLADALLIEPGSAAMRRTDRGKANFLKTAGEELAKRGIKEQLSAGQASIKQGVLDRIIFDLEKGLVPRPGTKITELYGLGDLTTVTPEMAKEANERRRELKGAIGQYLLSREKPKERRFAAKIPHYKPRYYGAELSRMRVAAAALEKLRQ